MEFDPFFLVDCKLQSTIIDNSYLILNFKNIFLKHVNPVSACKKNCRIPINSISRFRENFHSGAEAIITARFIFKLSYLHAFFTC